MNIDSAASIDVAYLAAATGTLLVAVVAAFFAFREHRNAREAFIQQMREEWDRLGPSWALILLAEHGGTFHYADGDLKLRAKGQKLHDYLTAAGEARQLDEGGWKKGRELTGKLNRRVRYIADVMRFGSVIARDAYHSGPDYMSALELRGHVRPVTRFFSYAADSVLRGRWRMSEAYEVFGPDIARHHRTVRELSHRGEWVVDNNWLIQATEFNTFDEQDRVYLFSFLLRAEQCRRGDTYAHFIVDLANEMRDEHRAKIRASLRRVRRTRRLKFFPLGVYFLLWRGRNPRVGSAYMAPEEPIIGGEDRHLFQRLGEPFWHLRWRIWLNRQMGSNQNNGIAEIFKQLWRLLTH